jgi:hypothetical protein
MQKFVTCKTLAAAQRNKLSRYPEDVAGAVAAISIWKFEIIDRKRKVIPSLNGHVRNHEPRNRTAKLAGVIVRIFAPLAGFILNLVDHPGLRPGIELRARRVCADQNCANDQENCQ